jgi:carboxymethylenebutenolidase
VNNAMTRKTAKDFHPETLKLFDDYVHGRLTRRGFLEGAGKFAVAGAAAESLLLALSPDFAVGQQVPPGDPRLQISTVEYPSPEGYGTVRGYLARPAKSKGKPPVILVVHENRGLNPHIEDIARRLALDDFIAFAPDALSPLGGYPGDEDKARELFPKLDQAKTHADFLAAVQAVKKFPGGNGRVGVVGFCYGGGIANFLATRVPDLGAAVPFYGAQPTAEDAARIKAPLLLHYAGNDERLTSAWPAYEAELKSAKVNYQAFIYPGVEHGFNNDTTPRYDPTAAKLAWQRTVEFFNKQLRAT